MSRLLNVGATVKAKSKRETKVLVGKLTRDYMDGTFDIQFKDNDLVERIEEKFIYSMDQDADDRRTSKPLYHVGESVKARLEQSRKWQQGIITRVHGDGLFDVAFDEGDRGLHVSSDRIQATKDLITSGRLPLQAGDAVQARYKKGTSFFKGTVRRICRDGTYDIDYDDGDTETHVARELIQVLQGQKLHEERRGEEVKSVERFHVGDAVRARYNRGSRKVRGEITAVHGDNTYDLRFDNGDKKENVLVKDIELEARGSRLLKKVARTLKVGDSVEATYPSGKKVFGGKISRVASDGTYDITSNDGNLEQRVPRSRIKSMNKSQQQDLSEKTTLESDREFEHRVETGRSESRIGTTSFKLDSKVKGFEVGDIIKARYKNTSRLVVGTVCRVRSDGTYDVRYDGGETEKHVKSSSIEPKGHHSLRDKGNDPTSNAFSVGDKVNVRYKGGLQRFPGKIAKVRMGGTYDIDYDDGDSELRVKGSAIMLVNDGEKTTESKQAISDLDAIISDLETESKTKKRIGNEVASKLKAGDVLEANFKQKGTFQRGKIIQTRSDGTLDIAYENGAVEKRVRIENIKINGNVLSVEESRDFTSKDKRMSDKTSSLRSDQRSALPRTETSIDFTSDSCESGHENQGPMKMKANATYRKAKEVKSRRSTHGIKYSEGDTTKRVARELVVEGRASKDFEDDVSTKGTKKNKAQEGFCRHERVLSCWRRASRLSVAQKTENWTKATVLEKKADDTYTVQYSDGAVEEAVPVEALKKKKQEGIEDGRLRKSETPSKRRERDRQRSGLSTESLFLLEQLAMTLFEEGVFTQKPKLQLLGDDESSSSSESSCSRPDTGSDSINRSSERTEVDKVFERLFDPSALRQYHRMFNENDAKQTRKISKSRVIAIVEELTKSRRPSNGSNLVNHMLTEWFATHADLRHLRHFEFQTLILAFAYAKSRLGMVPMEQSVATELEGRAVPYNDIQRQQELWQQKLGYRLFETLQRHFLDHALPRLIPLRIQVSKLCVIFDQVGRNSTPTTPLTVYLQQHELYPHHTLRLSEYLCCYFQLYGSDSAQCSQWSKDVELRPIVFVASCLFSNGDDVCKRHGKLVRRLSVGRTQAQVECILQFREVFESLSFKDTPLQDELLVETTQLSRFAASVALDPVRLEAAMNALRRRSRAVSLVEIYATCGTLIDELTLAPTIRNAMDRLRLRVDLADVRRIIGRVQQICAKILQDPTNADYWRIRADSSAFQQKIGRFNGATSLLEAVGFVEYHPAHYELRGVRNAAGQRVSELEPSSLDSLREKSIQLDSELALVDGVESISSILQRVAQACIFKGLFLTPDKCQLALQSLSLYMTNILKNPMESRCWRIREANTTFQRQIGYLPYAMELMDAIGFTLAPSSHGYVYTLRGTGTGSRHEHIPPSVAPFAASSVSRPMEWFLWRRQQEIDRLLEDKMAVLDTLSGCCSQVNVNKTRQSAPLNGDFGKMYPYGTNAIETFNKTLLQRRQLDTLRTVFTSLDGNCKGFLTEAELARAIGDSAGLPVWSRYEAFDIGKDGKVDFNDFVAALCPVLDHPYELVTTKNGTHVAAVLRDNPQRSLHEVTSLLVGKLRLETSSREAAATALENILHFLVCLLQERGHRALWSIHDEETLKQTVLCFAAGRELLHLVGVRETVCGGDKDVDQTRKQTKEHQPQQVRSSPPCALPSNLSALLDEATLTRVQTIAAMLAGHYRGMKLSVLSGISTVSRAISSGERCSDHWTRAVHVAVKCLLNIEHQAHNLRFRELKTTTTTFLKVVASVHGGVELLHCIGFREVHPGTLTLPMDVTIEEVKARRLEVEVGLALLQLRVVSEMDVAAEPLLLAPRAPDLTRRREIVTKQTPQDPPSTSHQQVQSGTESTHKVSASAQRANAKPTTLKPRLCMDSRERRNLDSVSRNDQKSRGKGTRTGAQPRSTDRNSQRNAGKGPRALISGAGAPDHQDC